MVNWYTHLLLEASRRQEAIDKAEQHRLLDGASRTAVPLKNYQRWLVSLGGLLVDWGCSLQAHYQSLAASAPVDLMCEGRSAPVQVERG